MAEDNKHTVDVSANTSLLTEIHPTPDPDTLLKELSFQLTVTRAMLKTVELDQILYIILSGITHGDGLNFNRAVLFLAWDRRNELRVSSSAGPANGEAAHRIWESIKAERLSLENLFDRYQVSSCEPQYLTTKLIGFSLKLDNVQAMSSLNQSAYALTDVISHCVATREPFFMNGVDAVYQDWGTEEEIRFSNFACVPIFLNGEVFGIILTDNCYNHRLINPDEMHPHHS